jgi:hypothetical protein
MKPFYMLAIKSMAAVRNFEIMSDKINAVGICTGGNYAQK